MNTSSTPRFLRRSQPQPEDMPDRDYTYTGLLFEPRIGDTWVTKLSAGLLAIVGVCFMIESATAVWKGHHMIHFANALLSTTIAVPACMVAAYLIFNAAKGKIE